MSITDHEPTAAAPSEDETASINAWSQADDETELVPTAQPRSWRLPVIAVTVATLATLAAVTIQLWPHHTQSAPKATPSAAPTVNPQVKTFSPRPQPAPTTPTEAPADPDARFLWLLSQQGLVPGNSGQALIDDAHQICSRLDQGYTFDQVVNQVVRGMETTQDNAKSMAYTSIDVYCTKYAGR